MQAARVGLGDAALQRQMQAAQTADAALGELGVAHVGQHVFDPQHGAVVVPQRQNLQHIGAGRLEGAVARPVGVDMAGQPLEVLARLFAQDQQTFLDRGEVGVEGRRRHPGGGGHVGGPDFAQVLGVQQLAHGAEQGATGARSAGADPVTQLVRRVGHEGRLDGATLRAWMDKAFKA
ncbi:hypothetical protein D3C80_1388490 [compost metagenome]